MSEDFKKNLGGNVGNGAKRNYFKPADHEGAYAFFIEPTKFTEEPNPFYDEEDARSRKSRNVATADLTIFKSPEDLTAGVATVLKAVSITDTYLASDLEDSVDKFEIARLATKPNKKGRPSWVWRAVPEPDVIDKVAAYYEAQQAQIAAALEGDDVPDYLQ